MTRVATDHSSSAAPVHRLFDEVLSGPRNLDVLDELLAPDYLDHSPSPGVPSSRAGVRVKLESLRAAFPDVRFTLEAAVAEGPLTAVRWHSEGTHLGPFEGIAPTGRRVLVEGMDFYRTSEGRITEHWDVVDEAGLMAQLGGGSPR
jgi:predicted ester cyclase